MAKIPKFKTKEEEREFWDTHSVVDYLEDLEETSELVFVRPKTKNITIKIDTEDIPKLKNAAKKKGLTVSSLVRMFIKDRLAKGLR